jgi:hypothetical protein
MMTGEAGEPAEDTQQRGTKRAREDSAAEWLEECEAELSRCRDTRLQFDLTVASLASSTRHFAI